MKIVEGRFYKTRKGNKIGPAKPDEHVLFGKTFHWRVGRYTYTHSGDVAFSEDADDIISEWNEGPVQVITETITRQTIVPGLYGRVKVNDPREMLSGDICHISMYGPINSAELRDAAATFLALAEALESQS